MLPAQWRHPRIRRLLLLLVMGVAVAGATVMVFAAEARAGSFDSAPPKAVLMKSSTVLQARLSMYSHWFYYDEEAGWAEIYYDDFDITYPEGDVVGAGRQLHIRFKKPERPSVSIFAYPRLGRDGVPSGQSQELRHTVRRVDRNGETVAWDVYFRVNRPDRHYYLDVYPVWEEVPGTHISYGDDIMYPLHVRTR